MNRLNDILKRILTGEFPITNNIKYHITIYSLAAVHGILVFFFLSIGIFPMAAYNFFSAITYLLCRELLKKDAYPTAYYITCGEIILNTICTTLAIGWESGFSLFLLALVAAGFYISYTFPQHRISSPFICGILASITYFCCYFIGQSSSPWYRISEQWIFQALYTFNSVCTLAFITVFSVLFMVDTRISQNKLFEENKMLGQIARTDALTGLHNRWSMANFLSDASVTKRPFCLVMCDIDDFKKVNDTYGHDCGDEVLKDIAKTLKSHVPKGSYVCRWGGEEFLILLNKYSLEESAALADKIRCSFAKHNTVFQDFQISHTMTMGIAQHSNSQTIESTIAKADMKLYIGKRNGKNIVVT